MEQLLTIPKEDIQDVYFSKEDVLHTPADLAERRHKLHRAMLLGNVYRSKVNISFRNNYNDLCKIETTVWAVFKNHVSVKSGKTIPIRAIENIEF